MCSSNTRLVWWLCISLVPALRSVYWKQLALWNGKGLAWETMRRGGARLTLHPGLLFFIREDVVHRLFMYYTHSLNRMCWRSWPLCYSWPTSKLETFQGMLYFLPRCFRAEKRWGCLPCLVWSFYLVINHFVVKFVFVCCCFVVVDFVFACFFVYCLFGFFLCVCAQTTSLILVIFSRCTFSRKPSWMLSNTFHRVMTALLQRYIHTVRSSQALLCDWDCSNDSEVCGIRSELLFCGSACLLFVCGNFEESFREGGFHTVVHLLALH